MVAPQGASWETLSWFAALIAMATHLNKFGFIAWFSDKAGTPPPSTVVRCDNNDIINQTMELRPRDICIFSLSNTAQHSIPTKRFHQGDGFRALP